MSTEDIGIVCKSCKHFNRVFSMERPESVLEMQREGDKHARPESCEECGASLANANLEPESERRRVAAKTAQLKREAVARAWGGRG